MNEKEKAELFKKAGESIIDYIAKEFQDEVSYSVFGNGYFIFEFGENSTIHFGFKKIPKWRFGLWLRTDEEETRIHYELFAQHEDLIDKFKPSNSIFEYSGSFSIDHLDSIYINLESFKLIYNEPYLAFWKHERGSLDEHYVTRSQAKRFYKNYYREEQRKENLSLKYFQVQKRLAKKVLKGYEYDILDGNTEDFIVRPRYTILMSDLDMTEEEREILHERWFESSKKLSKKFKNSWWLDLEISAFLSFESKRRYNEDDENEEGDEVDV